MMNGSTFQMINYMNGSVFSKARYMKGICFEILARTITPITPPPPTPTRSTIYTYVVIGRTVGLVIELSW